MIAALGAQHPPAGAVDAFLRSTHNLVELTHRLDAQTASMQRMNLMHFWAALLLSACLVATYVASGRPADLFCAIVWCGAFALHMWMRYRRKPQTETAT